MFDGVRQFVISTFEKMKLVTLHPKEFFERIKEEENVRPVLAYYCVLQIVVISWDLLIKLIRGYFVTYDLNQALFGFAFPLVIISLYHLFVHFLGGKNKINRTYQAFLYGLTPTLIAAFAASAIIPLLYYLHALVSLIFILLLLFAFIYSVYAVIIGISKLHEVTLKRAVLIYFSPVLFAFALLLVVTLFWIITLPIIMLIT